MATKILVHGFGHKAASWDETVSRMADGEAAVCPDLSSLRGKKAGCEDPAFCFVA